MSSSLRGDASRQHFSQHPQQIAQPERLGEPAAAALLEEAFGVGAGDVAGHEDDALGQPGVPAESVL